MKMETILKERILYDKHSYNTRYVRHPIGSKHAPWSKGTNSRSLT